MKQAPFKCNKKPKIIGSASVVGGLEAQGPLKSYFDLVSRDSRFEMDTWEKAESQMLRSCVETAIKKSRRKPEEIDVSFAGDLTNQCAASYFAMKETKIPHVGLYGACSTFVLGTGLAALSIEAGLGLSSVACASSHFSSAERQYRFPLEYGCQRTPTSQTTVTGAGCLVLSQSEENFPYVSEFFPGIIVDEGISDVNNMGAAMAPACADTLKRYFDSHGETKPEDFDLILTGDLGWEGHRIFLKLCKMDGINLENNSDDCGKMIYDPVKQSVNAGGSGCGCSASVFCSYIMQKFYDNEYKDVLLIGTGALLNTGTVLQNENIPGIAHLVRIRKDEVN